jgi:hypothetical protein
MVKFTIFLLVLTREEGIIMSFGSIALFFLILLISGIRKTKKLNEENRRLLESIDFNLQEPTEERYEDFTETHAYKSDSE